MCAALPRLFQRTGAPGQNPPPPLPPSPHPTTFLSPASTLLEGMLYQSRKRGETCLVEQFSAETMKYNIRGNTCQRPGLENQLLLIDLQDRRTTCGSLPLSYLTPLRRPACSIKLLGAMPWSGSFAGLNAEMIPQDSYTPQTPACITTPLAGGVQLFLDPSQEWPSSCWSCLTPPPPTPPPSSGVS